MNTQVKVDAFGVALAVVAWLCMASEALAQASPITLTNNVFQEVRQKAQDGALTTKRIPAVRVVPGGEVVYELGYSNTGKEVARGVTIDNPVPKDLELVSEGATPATAVSVDGGVTYGQLDELFVLGSDGEPRAARLSDVTHLRWVIAELAPGAQGKVSYRARVK